MAETAISFVSDLLGAEVPADIALACGQGALVEIKAAKSPSKRPVRPTGPTRDPWKGLDPDTRALLTGLADAARRHTMVRIYYRPKVQTAAGGPQAGRPPQVYRSVAPYSVRWRRVHVDGYDKPPRRVPVLFGYDTYKKSIKMFVADRIQNVTYIGRKFSPQWPVEWEAHQRDLELERLVDRLVQAEDALPQEQEILSEMNRYIDTMVARDTSYDPESGVDCHTYVALLKGKFGDMPGVTYYEWDESQAAPLMKRIRALDPESFSGAARRLIKDLQSTEPGGTFGHSFVGVGEHFVDPTLRSRGASQSEIDALDGALSHTYLASVDEGMEDRRQALASYLSGRSKPIADERSGKWRVIVLDNTWMLYLCDDLPQRVVPAGRWMDQWEAELGVSQPQYSELPYAERATLEAKLQVQRWISLEYYALCGEFYYPRKWDRENWLYADLSRANDYWKKWLLKHENEQEEESSLDIDTLVGEAQLSGEMKDMVVHWTDRESFEQVLDLGYLDEGSHFSLSLDVPFDQDNRAPYGLLLDKEMVVRSGYKRLPKGSTGVTHLELRYELNGRGRKVYLASALQAFITRPGSSARAVIRRLKDKYHQEFIPIFTARWPRYNTFDRPEEESSLDIDALADEMVTTGSIGSYAVPLGVPMHTYRKMLRGPKKKKKRRRKQKENEGRTIEFEDIVVKEVEPEGATAKDMGYISPKGQVFVSDSLDHDNVGLALMDEFGIMTRGIESVATAMARKGWIKWYGGLSPLRWAGAYGKRKNDPHRICMVIMSGARNERIAQNILAKMPQFSMVQIDIYTPPDTWDSVAGDAEVFIRYGIRGLKARRAEEAARAI